MLLHALVLASRSEYFKGVLLTGVGTRAARNAGGYVELTEVLTADDEALGAVEVLQHLYTGSVGQISCELCLAALKVSRRQNAGRDSRRFRLA